jgi:alpha-ketoglutarate-dependent taurine dioxygenase
MSHIAELGEGEGRRLIAGLATWATQRKFGYAHSWAPGDLIVWDNRRMMHAATELPDAAASSRLMWRTTITDRADDAGGKRGRSNGRSRL